MNSKPTILPSEYESRVKAVQVEMEKNEIDFIITFSHTSEPGYSRYLADFLPAFETAGVAIPRIGQACLLVGPESRERALLNDKLGSVKRLLAYREPATPKYEDNTFDTFDELLADCERNTPIKKLGIGGFNMIPMDIYAEIETALRKIRPEAEIVSANALLARVSQVKSEAEVACIREACRITRLAMDSAIDAVRAGITGDEVKGIALAKMYEKGAEGEAFLGWITCGNDTEFPICLSSKRPFVEGDLIQIQLGARYNGYASVIGRTVILGRPNEAQKELIESVLLAKQTVENELAGGRDSEAVALAHRKCLQSLGKESWMAYGPCHGTGMVECEAPWIECGSSYSLEKNMVFCVDIFLHNKEEHIGARYEDMVLITESGMEKLTDYGDELIQKY